MEEGGGKGVGRTAAAGGVSGCAEPGRAGGGRRRGGAAAPQGGARAAPAATRAPPRGRGARATARRCRAQARVPRRARACSLVIARGGRLPTRPEARKRHALVLLLLLVLVARDAALDLDADDGRQRQHFRRQLGHGGRQEEAGVLRSGLGAPAAARPQAPASVTMVRRGRVCPTEDNHDFSLCGRNEIISPVQVELNLNLRRTHSARKEKTLN